VADIALFSKGSAVDVEQLHARLRQTAFLVPGLSLAVLDRRSGELVEEVFRFDGGTADFVEHLAPDRPVCDPIHVVGTGTYKETVPVLDDSGHMSTQTVERTCEVDVALRWGTGYDTVVQSFCNVVATGHGGTHQNGFERALLRSLNEALKSTRVLRANDDPVLKDDVLEGLTAVVTVKVPEPQYLGQTKDELGTPGVSKIVADVVGKELKAQFLDNRRTKAVARQVLEKVAAAAKTRLAARASKDAARARTRSRPRPCRPSSPTAAAPTSSAPSCGWSRATARSAPASSRATPSTRRCSPCAGRSSTSRRPA
jgi:DNA gyrase subunit B